MDLPTSGLPLPGLTARLAGYVADAAARPASIELQRLVRTGFVDTAAVMIAGRDEPVTRVVRAWVAARAGQPVGARLLFSDERASPRDAALVNGVAAHALDYDDVGLQGHPSAVLVPALLAEGEQRGSSGAALISAYVVGYEIWAELIARDAGLHHLKGWHPTAVFGTLAAAGAVAALRRLDAARVQHALGLAASMGAGLTANFGSMAKPFHAGQAAAHGIDAVDLAQAGMTAAPDVLEHPQGFLMAISPQGQIDSSPPAVDFGAVPKLAVLGLTVKKYPMCFATHRVLDAALDLVRTHDIRPEQIQRMQASVGPAQASMLRNARPGNALEAKFSLQFAVASALVARACGLTELNDEFVRRPDVQALFSLLDVQTVDTYHPTEPTLAASDRLVLRLRDGRVLDSGEVYAARGDASSPLGEEELTAKFLDCTRSLPADARQRLLEGLLRLPEVENVAAMG
ncbi:MAG: MmgE/PrpD family protein [Pigmentiphaga sp.]